MCGRFSLGIDQTALAEHLNALFGIEKLTFSHQPRYNIAPSQSMVAVIYDGQRYKAGYLSWGFVPKYLNHKNPDFKPINARIESVYEKPYFKEAMHKNRCIIIADAFYEWQRKDHDKVPIRITDEWQPLLLMAGLYGAKDASNSQASGIILTQAANQAMRFLHARMPVLLDIVSAKAWLRGDIQHVNGLTYQPALNFKAVSKALNYPQNEGEHLINAQ